MSTPFDLSCSQSTEGGIYAIYGPNGRLYIGQTNSFDRRWMVHKSALRGGRHHCAALQHAWEKYGADAFQFARIAIVPHGEARNEAEQYYMDLLGRGVLYNSLMSVGSPRIGIAPSDETRAKMSAAHSGSRNVNFGKRMSPETKRKLSLSKIGKYAGAKSASFGKPKTAEHRMKLSEALKGKLVGASNPVACPVVCVDTGEKFDTFAAAASWLRANGWPKADHSTIRKAAHGILNRVYGLRWALFKAEA